MRRCSSCNSMLDDAFSKQISNNSSINREVKHQTKNNSYYRRRKKNTNKNVYERLFMLSNKKNCTCQKIPTKDDKIEIDDDDDVNCTFFPTVNRTHEALLARWTEGVSVFERLYGNALFLQERKERMRSLEFRKNHHILNTLNNNAIHSLEENWWCSEPQELNILDNIKHVESTKPRPTMKRMKLSSPFFTYNIDQSNLQENKPNNAYNRSVQYTSK